MWQIALMLVIAKSLFLVHFLLNLNLIRMYCANEYVNELMPWLQWCWYLRSGRHSRTVEDCCTISPVGFLFSTRLQRLTLFGLPSLSDVVHSKYWHCLCADETHFHCITVGLPCCLELIQLVKGTPATVACPVQLYPWYLHIWGGVVVQWVEHWTGDQQVVGSNPTRAKAV